MNYYSIECAVGEREVGLTFPQSHVAKHPVKVDDPRHLWKQGIGKFRENVVIPEPVLHPDAILTDLVSCTVISARLLISDKLKSILEKSVTSGECEFLPVRVWYINEEFPYWILNPIVFRMELIDFANSEIWLEGTGGVKIRKINIKDYTDFKEWIHKLALPERITMHNFVFMDQAEQDFIQLRYGKGGIGFYVSEKIKKEIESACCSGIRFTKSNETE